MVNIISLENVSKSYTERALLENVSFNMEDNDKIGLIGINGTGKSTLLNLIAGNDIPDSGTITIPRSTTIEYLSQNPESNPDAAVLEQVLNGDTPAMKIIKQYEMTLEDISKNPDSTMLQDRLLALTSEINSIDAWHLESQVKTILTKLGINDFYARMGTLSGGQKKRVALASALINPCNLLLLDEPTNHMDNETIDWFEKQLKARNGALLMITHDRYFLDRVVNKIIELDHGKLYTYSGNYSLFVEKKVERQLVESSLEAKRHSLYKQELAWMRTGARARTTKQKARIKRFEGLEKSKHIIDESKLDISVGHSRLGKKIIEINGISISFGDNPVIKDFNYILSRNDRVGIVGDNGTGKSTLLNIIAGKLSPDSNSVDIGTTVKIGYLSQESEDMDNSFRAIEYIKDTAEYITTADGTKISASQMLERFLFPADMQWTFIAKLSGGEKRRLYLLKILMEAPNVLLLDEPTNDLDIDTLQVLENYLDEFSGAVISVSHDRYFLDRTCHRIFSFEGQGKIKEHIGNYSDFAEYKALTDTGQVKAAKINHVPKIAKIKQPKLKFTYKEQIEFDHIDSDIEALENEISLFDDEMSKMSSDFIKLQELVEKKEQFEEELLYKMERWEYLNDLDEQIKNSRHDQSR